MANEVSLLQRARHPNVVRYYGTFYNDDFMWVSCLTLVALKQRLYKLTRLDPLFQIIMEYCAIGSIAGMQKYGIRFSELQLASIITSVLHGLAYLHTMGIVRVTPHVLARVFCSLCGLLMLRRNFQPHRDLKCSNILMNELGDAKLGTASHLLRGVPACFRFDPTHIRTSNPLQPISECRISGCER